MTAAHAPQPSANSLPEVALIWRRSDFSESSRLITLVTPDHGKVTALAKGAHRPGSPLLGKVDHLNLVYPRFAKRKGTGILLLRGLDLVREHRGLRQPRRFAAAAYLVEIFDVAMLAGRPDPQLFDLLVGALHVLEKCPARNLPKFVTGLELRFLSALGLLPDLAHCSECGTPATQLHVTRRHLGLVCATHAEGGRPIPAPTLAWLRRVARTPGREWDALPQPDQPTQSLLGRWISVAIERQTHWRGIALRK